MGKIYIRTYAYNAEKTIRRCIESILKQTMPEFIYYLCDNGSTDGTRRIIEQYACKDKRIKAFYNSVNRNYLETEECLFLPYNIGEEDYFCVLDADDEYMPDFLEQMLEFMDKYQLDIGACGSDFISAEHTHKIIGTRVLDEDLIMGGTGFSKYFMQYHCFMRTTWGKLFKGFTMYNTVQDSRNPNFPAAYGGDTYNSMIAFSNAKRVGVLGKSLHKYYVSRKSVSYTFIPERRYSAAILHESALNYLNHYGKISIFNEDFLYAVYLMELLDAWNVLIKATLPNSEKLTYVGDMFLSKHTKELAGREDFGLHCCNTEYYNDKRNELFQAISNWLMSFSEVQDNQMKLYCELGEFCCAACYFEKGWLWFKKQRVLFLIYQECTDEANEELNELTMLIPEDDEVMELKKMLV